MGEGGRGRVKGRRDQGKARKNGRCGDRGTSSNNGKRGWKIGGNRERPSLAFLAREAILHHKGRVKLINPVFRVPGGS